MKKIITIILCILIFISCKEYTLRNNQYHSIKKGEYSIANIYQYDTLSLFAHYKECGEWGGHTEIFKIYRKKNKEIWADYKKDTVNCRGEITRKIIYEKSIKLSQEYQEMIIEYMHDLLNQNFINKPLNSNAGDYYSVIASDSSLVISHYASHYDGFEVLRDKITQ